MLIASFIVSLISLSIAGLTFYLSQIRKANIAPIVGPEFDVYHHDYSSGISTGIIIPISFVNDTQSTGTVTKVSATVWQKGCEEEKYFMLWHKFEVLNESTGKWDHDCNAHPLVLSPKNGVQKNVWFMWHAFNKEKLFLTKGSYVLCVHYWIDSVLKPKKIEKNFYINEDMENIFSNFRSGSKTNSLKITLEKEMAFNKMLNVSEFKKLL